MSLRDDVLESAEDCQVAALELRQAVESRRANADRVNVQSARVRLNRAISNFSVLLEKIGTKW